MVMISGYITRRFFYTFITMKIGVPKEIKPQESRVGMTPATAALLVQSGHQVVVQATAGEGSNCPDATYKAVGCTL